MRVIFLDCDGVLNDLETKERLFGFIGLDHKLLDKLKILYDTSNSEEETRIVVSSSWRMDEIYNREENMYQVLLKELADRDMEVLGYTPMLHGWDRAEEILSWYNDNKEKYNVTSFVILDDEEFDFNNHEETKNNFISTLEFLGRNEISLGITDNIIQKSLEVLRRKTC